jgi:hypothetical protein
MQRWPIRAWLNVSALVTQTLDSVCRGKLAKQVTATEQHLMQKQMTKALHKCDAVELMTVMLAAFEEEHHYL